jgi:hypothetical protein
VMQMSEKKNLSAVVIICLLIAASAMAAIVVKRKKVAANCSDLRVAMDGGYTAVLRTGGISPSTDLTIYKLRNRKKVRLGTVPVMAELTKEGLPFYEGDGVRLLISKNAQGKTGRHLASLDGEMNGEKVSATLSCEK